ncbi:SDR family NAD(P)-dependent oxidoreductase [Candidatus Pelagibacter sp.]|nr:SDR family NAD(P)-dependent oxidoreductase [Candidatus Pelagibacter sp.]
MDKKKVLVVLGASSGIANELNKFFYKKFAMYFFYFKNKPKYLKNTKSIKLNLQNYKKLKNTLNTINLKKKKIIILNLASIKIDKVSYYINNNDMEKTFSVNFFSFLNFIQHFLPEMIKIKWGRVINFSSTAGAVGEKGTLLYTASKNATHGMIKVMSKEYAQFNLTFNTIELGNFDYGLFKKLKPSMREKIISNIPSKKTGDIKDIYNTVNFIINSNYVNGAKINVDGGFSVN